MWAVGRISLLSWGRPEAPAAEVVAITPAAVAVLPAADLPVAAVVRTPESVEADEPRGLATAALRMQDEPATLVIPLPDEVSDPAEAESSGVEDEAPDGIEAAELHGGPTSVGVIEPDEVGASAPVATVASDEDIVAAVTIAPVESTLQGPEGSAEDELVAVAAEVRDLAPAAMNESPRIEDSAGESAPESILPATATAPAPAPEPVDSAPPIDAPEAEPAPLVDAIVEVEPAPPEEVPDVEVPAATVTELEPVVLTPITTPEPVVAVSTIPPEAVATPAPAVEVGPILPPPPSTGATPAKPFEATAPPMGFLRRLFLRILNFFRAILGL